MVVRERIDALGADAVLQGLQDEHRAEQAKKAATVVNARKTRQPGCRSYDLCFYTY